MGAEIFLDFIPDPSEPNDKKKPGNLLYLFNNKIIKEPAKEKPKLLNGKFYSEMDYTEKIEVCVSSVKINLYEESLKTLDDSEYPGVKETLKELILENHPDEMIPLALDTPTFIRDKFKFRY